MKRAVFLLATAVVLTAGIANADDDNLCQGDEPKYVLQSEFGPFDLGDDDQWCPKTEDPDGGCSFVRDGVNYGTTHGFIVRKNIDHKSFSGKMPFGLKWGDTITSAERKILAVTKGRPAFDKFAQPPELHTKGGSCLLTKRGVEYMMNMTFDDNQKLVAINTRLLFP